MATKTSASVKTRKTVATKVGKATTAAKKPEAKETVTSKGNFNGMTRSEIKARAHANTIERKRLATENKELWTLYKNKKGEEAKTKAEAQLAKLQAQIAKLQKN